MAHKNIRYEVVKHYFNMTIAEANALRVLNKQLQSLNINSIKTW